MEERESLPVGGRGDIGTLAARIVTWMRGEVTKAKAGGLVLGLSGGVDSAVVAALAVRACGKETLGLLLPCESDPADLSDARLVAGAVGMKTAEIDLAPVLAALLKGLPQGDRLARGNLKARLRMIALYHLARSRGFLVAGTGNRTEIELGFFAQHGDGGGDILPLGSLLKREVREMALALGVPERIVAKTPSAGLWKGQTDEGELGASYDELDRALELLGSARERAAPPGAMRVLAERRPKTGHKRIPPPVFPR